MSLTKDQWETLTDAERREEADRARERELGPSAFNRALLWLRRFMRERPRRDTGATA